MGKVEDNALLAGLAGRTGRVVIRTRNGKEYSSIRPKKPKGETSVIQVMIRQRMKDAVTFMESYRKFACKYFGHTMGDKSRYNQAMSNILESIKIDYDQKTVKRDFKSIAFAKGLLPAMQLKEMNKTSDSTISIAWLKTTGDNPEYDSDKLQILIAPEDQYTSELTQDVAARGSLNCDVEISKEYQGKTLHIYAAFKSEDGKSVSNSKYLGRVS